MRCAFYNRTNFAIVETWLVTPASPAASQVSWKVYDLRDLNGLMVPTTQPTSEPRRPSFMEEVPGPEEEEAVAKKLMGLGDIALEVIGRAR